jgi:hypothetical protein
MSAGWAAVYDLAGRAEGVQDAAVAYGQSLDRDPRVVPLASSTSHGFD